MYDQEKTVHLAAYLLRKAGGSMDYLKLHKLLYLAERENLGRWADTMSGDSFIQLQHGPVLHDTFECAMSGEFWDQWVEDAGGNVVALKKERFADDLDKLSTSDEEVLDLVFKEYGCIPRPLLLGLMRNSCKEWVCGKPDGSPVTYEEIFSALGYSGKDRDLMVSQAEEADSIRAYWQKK